MFNNYFFNKKILITGNTGFKGTWLTNFLLIMKSNIIGVSKDIPTKPSMFKATINSGQINQYFFDIKNFIKLKNVIYKENPDIIFHLAAQPLVKKSFEDTIETWETNVIGTVNLLEALKTYKKKIIVIIITSDKSYKNKEWVWGYRENDELGGSDPYSASKASAEFVINSYYQSFLNKKGNIRLSIARAGNVIGGGDWAANRIIPDCINSWSKNKIVKIKNPNSTRPWQHVLEPISGYLQLAHVLSKNKKINGQAFNFGPNLDQNKNVKNLVKKMASYWQNKKWSIDKNNSKIIESRLLSLNCEKSKELLKWTPTLSFDEMSEFTISWYKTYYSNKKIITNLTYKQIKDFMSKF